MTETNERLVVREDVSGAPVWAAAFSQVWFGLTGSHGSPVVNPAFGPASHCIGVRALSRLILASPASAATSSPPEFDHILVVVHGLKVLMVLRNSERVVRHSEFFALIDERGAAHAVQNRC